jgi:hypothetical protein
MLFKRYPRYEELTMSDRKIAAFIRKQAKERNRYPLFLEHVEREQHSLNAERLKRIQVDITITQQQRDYRARSWRKARANFFALPETVKEIIRADWLVWVGPRDPSYFAWMIDVHSGEQARRRAIAAQENRKLRERIARELDAQESGVLI